MKEWYESLYENYSRKYDKEPFAQGTAGECDFIEEERARDKSLKIFDIGCGTGRHAIELAKRGYKIVGIDLSESQHKRAREKAREAGVTIDFQTQDARNLPFDGEFDLAIMLCRPTWAEDMAGTEGLAFELTYYHHKVDGAIQARDIQGLLNSCLEAGGEDEELCEPFSRQSSGNLNPPNNQIDNLGKIETDGVDIKVDWSGLPVDWGQFVASLQATYINDYKAVDSLGFVSQRRVGVEVSDSAIPEWQANVRLGWNLGSWEATWTLRYIDEVKDNCGNA